MCRIEEKALGRIATNADARCDERLDEKETSEEGQDEKIPRHSEERVRLFLFVSSGLIRHIGCFQSLLKAIREDELDHVNIPAAVSVGSDYCRARFRILVFLLRCSPVTLLSIAHFIPSIDVRVSARYPLASLRRDEEGEKQVLGRTENLSLSMMTEIITRVPRMHGLPWQIDGSMLILRFQSMFREPLI